MSLNESLTNAAQSGTDVQPTVRQAQFDAKALKRSARRADKIASSATRARERIAEHLSQQARAGRVVDEREVSLATLADPFTVGKSIYFAWDGQKAPEAVTYSIADFPDGTSQTGMGVEYSGGGEVPSHYQPLGGSGYDAGFNVKNMYREDNGCTTAWFSPQYAADRDHKLVSCYEVWAQDKTVHFIYNRWALWTPAPTTSFGYWVETHNFYVASRPWKNHEADLVKLNDWAPRHLTKTCDKKSDLTLGGAYGGVTGSVTIPISECEDYWLDINTNIRKIGIDYLSDDTPSEGREGQMYMDVAGDFNAKNATVLPIWADYNWVTAAYCTLGRCERYSYVQKDSGW